MKLDHLISTKQFTDHKALDELFTLAKKYEEEDAKKAVKPELAGNILATLFYEPSTRTRFSFETAMLKLGGQVISAESAAQFSSAKKGETLTDTIKTVQGYADAIVLRHPEKGSAAEAASVASVPVINAGDGAGEHPTQALLDTYTLQKERGTINGVTIGLVGDLLYSRTVHSWLTLLNLYHDVTVLLITPPSLKLPQEYIKAAGNIVFKEESDLAKAAKQVDALYVTRVQQERFATPEEYEKVKDAYIVNEKVLEAMHSSAIVMHPLPRVNEISPSIDDDPRAAYFRQAKNGMYVRMAILKTLL